MRVRILVVIGILLLIPAGITYSGPGFRSSVRDFLGPQSPNSYGVYTIERVIENHSAFLALGTRIQYIGVGDLDVSKMSSGDAQKAYEFHKRIAFTKLARLEFDSKRIDQNGHVIAYVFVRPWPNADNEIFLNAELIRQGHARFVPDRLNNRYNDLFRELEKEAILARRGMWLIPSIVRETP